MSNTAVIDPKKVHINMEMNIDQKDLIDTAVAIREEELYLERDVLRKDIATLTTNINKAHENLTKSIKTSFEENFESKRSDVEKTMSSIGGVSFTVKTANTKINKKGRIEGCIQIHRKSANDGYYNTSLDIPCTMAKTKSVKDLEKVISDTSKTKADKQAELHKVNNNITNVGRMQRSARAKLVQTAIAGNKDLLRLLPKLD